MSGIKCEPPSGPLPCMQPRTWALPGRFKRKEIAPPDFPGINFAHSPCYVQLWEHYWVLVGVPPWRGSSHLWGELKVVKPFSQTGFICIKSHRNSLKCLVCGCNPCSVLNNDRFSPIIIFLWLFQWELGRKAGWEVQCEGLNVTEWKSVLAPFVGSLDKVRSTLQTYERYSPSCHH